MPRGASLGFGLSHSYPVTKDTDFEKIPFKGYDAILMEAFRRHDIRCIVGALYDRRIRGDGSSDLKFREDPEGDSHYEPGPTSFLVNFIDYGETRKCVPKGARLPGETGRLTYITTRFIDFPKYQDEDQDETWENFIEEQGIYQFVSVDNLSDFRTAVRRDRSKKSGRSNTRLLWVTPPSRMTGIEKNFTVYGNEAMAESIYAALNLIFLIPASPKIIRSLPQAKEPEPDSSSPPSSPLTPDGEDEGPE
jgi:hypothetical protein